MNRPMFGQGTQVAKAQHAAFKLRFERFHFSEPELVLFPFDAQPLGPIIELASDWPGRRASCHAKLSIF